MADDDDEPSSRPRYDDPNTPRRAAARANGRFGRSYYGGRPIPHWDADTKAEPASDTSSPSSAEQRVSPDAAPAKEAPRPAAAVADEPRAAATVVVEPDGADGTDAAVADEPPLPLPPLPAPPQADLPRAASPAADEPLVFVDLTKGSTPPRDGARARGDNCCYEYDVEWAGGDCNADCVALSSGMLGEMFCWALMRRKPGDETPPGSPKATVTSGR